jgi:hypothetical protein
VSPFAVTPDYHFLSKNRELACSDSTVFLTKKTLIFLTPFSWGGGKSFSNFLLHKTLIPSPRKSLHDVNWNELPEHFTR